MQIRAGTPAAKGQPKTACFLCIVRPSATRFTIPGFYSLSITCLQPHTRALTEVATLMLRYIFSLLKSCLVFLLQCTGKGRVKYWNERYENESPFSRDGSFKGLKPGALHQCFENVEQNPLYIELARIQM